MSSASTKRSPSRNRAAWQKLVLEGYFDDSGTHQGSRVVTVGGCVARAEQWELFVPAWRQALKEFEVQVFRSSDLASSQGEFEGWEDEEKRSLITALAKVMRQSPKAAFSGLVVAEDYRVIPAWARKTAAFGDEYNFCLQMCVGQVMDWVQKLNPPMPPRNQISFALDQQPKREGVSRNTYQYIKEFRDPDDKMGVLSFADKKKCLPLQAADFVAYESYKHLDNGVRNSGRKIRGSFRVLVENLWEFNGHVFRDEELRELSEHYERTMPKSGEEPWWPWYHQPNKWKTSA